MPGACCTRGLVCKMEIEAHTSIQVQPESLRKGEHGRRKCRQINAMQMLCSHLCRDPMLIWMREETWGHIDAYRAL